jgi:hypothetical protein
MSGAVASETLGIPNPIVTPASRQRFRDDAVLVSGA